MSSTPFSLIVRVDRGELSTTPVANESLRPTNAVDDHTDTVTSPATTSTATQTASNSTLAGRSSASLEEVDKRCWICFGEESDSVGKWVRPCKCSLICHEECLLNWITENQKSTALKKLRITMPPSPSLTISLLPWARIAYNYSYNRLFGRLEATWRRQLEPYNATSEENGENGNERRRENQDVLDRLDRSNAGRKILSLLWSEASLVASHLFVHAFPTHSIAIFLEGACS
ncbi:9459_t:CDS:2 [Acaulospora colombiana]|uniref:9459_t:CDS:1 n=1 Tax=Acaulospora colombiana TaxID=27376 RepID=A0ACA9KZ21_9GLOM|nr:9459_t:CDS:2 [Acaulospora colombiana]